MKNKAIALLHLMMSAILFSSTPSLTSAASITCQATADTTLDSLNPDLNLGHASVGSFGNVTQQVTAFLVRFDLSAIPPGSTIDAASIVLKANESAVDGSQVFSVWKAAGNWDEYTATWKNPQTSTSLPRLDFTYTNYTTQNGVGLFFEDVTPIVKKWIENGEANNGFEVGIAADSTIRNPALFNIATREDTTVLRRPTLIVDFTLPKYTLEVDSSGASGVTISSSTGHGGTTDYQRFLDSGTHVTLTAPATAGGKTFQGWTGDITGSGTTISFDMSKTTVVTATYATPKYTLEVDSSGASGVTISSSTGHGGTTDYQRFLDSGTHVTLTAPATAGGKTFQGWTGDITGSGTTISFDMSKTTVVSAKYSALSDWLSHNGHQYKLTAPGLTWEQAEAEAVAAGGHLATINDESENTWVFDTFGPNSTNFWIGLHQPANSPEPGGDWEWISGEAVSYTNWGPGQPDNNSSPNSGEQNYSLFKGQGTVAAGMWDDYGNASTFPGLIERIPPSTSLTLKNANGTPGSNVVISVMADGLRGSTAWCFDVTYDTAKLSFVKADKGSATSDWATITPNENPAGTVRVGGFAGTGTPVSGDQKEICKLTFQIKSTVSNPGSATLTPASPTDDLSGATLHPGTISWTAIWLGDGNDDQQITPGDAQIAFEHYLHGDSANDHPEVDVNHDGHLTPGDAQAIFEWWLGGHGSQPMN